MPRLSTSYSRRPLTQPSAASEQNRFLSTYSAEVNGNGNLTYYNQMQMEVTAPQSPADYTDENGSSHRLGTNAEVPIQLVDHKLSGTEDEHCPQKESESTATSNTLDSLFTEEGHTDLFSLPTRSAFRAKEPIRRLTNADLDTQQLQRVRPRTSFDNSDNTSDRGETQRVDAESAYSNKDEVDLLEDGTDIGADTTVFSSTLPAVFRRDGTNLPIRETCSPPANPLSPSMADNRREKENGNVSALTQIRAPPAFGPLSSTSIGSSPLHLSEAHAREEEKKVDDKKTCAQRATARCNCRAQLESTVPCAVGEIPDENNTYLPVQVWIPRRAEALGDPVMTATTLASSVPSSQIETAFAPHGSPQPVIWRRHDALHDHREEMADKPQQQRSSVLTDSANTAVTVTSSPLSSKQWCVTAFECVSVQPFTELAAPLRNNNKRSVDVLEEQWLHECGCGADKDSTGDDYDSDAEDAAGGAAKPTGAVNSLSVRFNGAARAQVGGKEEEAAAAAGGSTDADRRRVGCGSRRHHRSSSSNNSNAKERDCRVRRVEDKKNNSDHSTLSCLRGGRQQQQCVYQNGKNSTVSLLSYSSRTADEQMQGPHPEVLISLPWLLRTCTLPPLPAALLIHCLEAYICTSVPLHPRVKTTRRGDPRASSQAALFSMQQSELQQQQQRGECNFSFSPALTLELPTLPPSAPSLPFWIAAFAYTQAIQTHATTFASRLVHEAEAVALNTPTSQNPASTFTKPTRAPSLARSSVTNIDTGRNSLNDGKAPGVVKTPLECITWPPWVPTVQWSTQVLTALSSAAFVLIHDVAHVLQYVSAAVQSGTVGTKNDKGSDSNTLLHNCKISVSGKTNKQRLEAAEQPSMKNDVNSLATIAAAEELGTISFLLREFHVFCEAIFGDAENKKLCRHVRDRLPVHLHDLSELLARPWCGEDGTSAARAQQQRQHNSEDHFYVENDYKLNTQVSGIGMYSTSCVQPLQTHPALSSSGSMFSVSRSIATRCPSMLDLVHHFAHAWMRECFPALARRLHLFLTSHDPGVVLDKWYAISNQFDRNLPHKGRRGDVSRLGTTQEKHSNDEAGKPVNANSCCRNAFRALCTPTTITTQAALHDAVYDCVHSFTHGVLHRWERWSSVATAAASTSEERTSSLSSSSQQQHQQEQRCFSRCATRILSNRGPYSSGSGTALQWCAHVNYAKVLSLQWILQHDSSIGCSCNRRSEHVIMDYINGNDNEVMDKSAMERERECGTDPAAAALTDMKAVLEQLTILPGLFDSTLLLPQEVQCGLRRACATVHLVPPRQQNDVPGRTNCKTKASEVESFHACFRLFFGIACYGGAQLSRSGVEGLDVAAIFQTSPQLSSSCSTSASLNCTQTTKGNDLAVDVRACMSRNLEIAASIWKEWLLPLIVRYHESCRNTNHQLPAEVGGGKEESANTSTFPRKEPIVLKEMRETQPQSIIASTAVSQQHLDILGVADQMVLYALTLLQLVREAQRLVTTTAAVAIANVPTTGFFSRCAAVAISSSSSVIAGSVGVSSRKRRRCSSGERSERRSHYQQRQPAFQQRRVGVCSATTADICTSRNNADEEERKDDVDADIGSLCSPCSMSSYATASTTTASLPQCNQPKSCVAGSCSGEVACENEEKPQKMDWGKADKSKSKVQVASSRREAPARVAAAAQRNSAWAVPSLQVDAYLQTANQAGGLPDRTIPDALAHPLCGPHTDSRTEPGWQAACRTLAHRWLSCPPPQQHQQKHEDNRRCDGLQDDATQQQSHSRCCTRYVIHRRDVRHLRVFFICLRDCIYRVRREQEEQQQQQRMCKKRYVKGEDCALKLSNNNSDSSNNTDICSGHDRYDYLYGVLPPGLRAGEGGVTVLEVTSDSSSRSSLGLQEDDTATENNLKSNRIRPQRALWAGTNISDSDEVGPLHLTSTDSMSGKSQSNADGDGKVEDDEEGGGML